MKGEEKQNLKMYMIAGGLLASGLFCCVAVVMFLTRGDNLRGSGSLGTLEGEVSGVLTFSEESPLCVVDSLTTIRISSIVYSGTGRAEAVPRLAIVPTPYARNYLAGFNATQRPMESSWNFRFDDDSKRADQLGFAAFWYLEEEI